jgi:hypothetical protein
LGQRGHGHRTHGGERLTVRRTHAKGDPEAALSPIELIAKARMLMNYGGVREPDRLIDAILALSDDALITRIALKVKLTPAMQQKIQQLTCCF